MNSVHDSIVIDIHPNEKEAVLDIGLNVSTKGSRIYAALKGVVDSGINIPHSPEIFPSEDRLAGKHIQNIKPEELQKNFEEVKGKVS